MGDQAVTVRATNRVDFADQTFTVAVASDTFPPTAPTAVQVVDVTATTVELSWNGATDAVGVDHYGVFVVEHARPLENGFRVDDEAFG